jgi:hypothetical protein
MPAKLFGLVYMSKAVDRFSQHDLTKLLEQSRRENQPVAITGLLLYVDGNFMQLFEGAQEKIEALMSRIKRDRRHHEVIILEAGPIKQRHFSDWSMAFLNFNSPQVRALPGFSTYLEAPFARDDMAETQETHVRLLQYFRAVMTASDSAMLRLAEAVEFPAEDPAREKRKG